MDAHPDPAPWKEEDCSLSSAGTAFLIASYGAVMALGLAGNACLVSVILWRKETRNVTNVFIANLSCSDILMALVCVPVTIVYTLMDRWVLGDALCRLTPFVQCVSVSVSTLSLVLITAERHQLIVHPTGWRPALTQAYVAVGATWAAACLLSAPFLSYSVLAFPFQNLSVPFAADDHMVCMERWPSLRQRRAYTTALLVLQYVLPLALIAACYLRVYLRLRRRREARFRARGSARVNAMLVAIVVAFAVAWLPLNVFNAVFDWDHEALPSCGHDVVFSFCHLVAMASTCVNPIVYGFLNSNVQKQLRAAAARWRCWGVAERYESVPLSTVSTEVTKGSVLSNGSLALNT